MLHRPPPLEVLFQLFYSFNILTKDTPKFKKPLKNIHFHIIYITCEYRFQHHTNIAMLETAEGMM